MYVISFKIVFLSMCLVVACCAASNEDERRHVVPPKRVAIIGGGIGGTSAAYFIKDKFGVDIHVDLYESDQICGRLATVSIAGREYESGGSIIHPLNKYMQSFLEKFSGLEKARERPGGLLGFFDGTEYILRTSRWKIVTFIKMFWNFGLDLMRLHWLEDNFMDKFMRIYELQEQGESFENVSILLHGMGGNDFVHATQITSEELFSSYGIRKFTIDNLVTPALQNNYGQNASANGFVGAVSMAGIQSGLWSVSGGNKRVCDSLISESSANLIRQRVTSVRFDEEAEDGKFLVTTDNGPRQSYDIVIIAAPIRRGPNYIDVSQACESEVSCPGLENDEMPYRRTVANFFRGKLNSTLFKCNSMEECPGFFLIPNQELFYRSIGLHVPVDYDPEVDEVRGIYKVFTTEPMTKEQADLLFESYEEKATVDWLAYPYYNPPDKLDSFVLNKEGLYYISPIEWAASAMEMSVVSAKNSVLLAYNNWCKITQNMAHVADSRSAKEDL